MASSYLYYRLYITQFYRANSSVSYCSIAEWKLYDSNGNDLARQSGCSYSASSTGEGNVNNVFDNNTSTFWHSNYSSQTLPQWVKVQLPQAGKIASYSICPRNYMDGGKVDRPTAWKLQGSNDGSTWDDIDVQSGLTDGWAANTYRNFPVQTAEIKYLLESGGDYYSIVSDVITNVGSVLDAQLFADYGMDAIPDWSDYSSLSNPSVLCWSNEDFVDMIATTEGLPSPQIVVSAGISLIQPNTDGIDSVTIEDSGSPTYAFSVDDGTTWKIWSGSAWVASSGTDMSGSDVESLTKEEWDLLTDGETFIKIRFTLTADTDTVESITITYARA